MLGLAGPEEIFLMRYFEKNQESPNVYLRSAASRHQLTCTLVKGFAFVGVRKSYLIS
jgi:hypothetical protein